MRTDAVYQDGVFKPLTPVTFKENQRVFLEIEPAVEQDVKAWLEETDRLREQIKAKYGILPDGAGHRRGPHEMSNLVVDSCVIAKWACPNRIPPWHVN